MRSKSTLIDRDRLNNADKGAVSNAMVRLFDRVQNLPKEVQVLALAGAMALMSEVAQVAPQEAMTAIYNLMLDPQHSSGRDHRFAAMSMHLRDELQKSLR